MKKLRRLKESTGNEVTDNVIEEAINEPIPIVPIDDDVGEGEKPSLIDGKVITVTFNVAARIEVQIANPLGKIPTVCIPIVPFDRGCMWYVDDTCAWDEETLGFKVNVNTTISSGTLYTGEDIGDGDASNKNFSGTLFHPGIKPGSLVIAAVVVGGGTETFVDNGDGTLTSDGATPGIGTIDYTSGIYDITFCVAPDTGVDIFADYIGAFIAALTMKFIVA